MKIYLVHHEIFIPKEGITKYRVYPFLSRWEAESYCLKHCIDVDHEGYNFMTDEDIVTYVVENGWSPEYMYIESVEVMDDDSEFKTLYKTN